MSGVSGVSDVSGVSGVSGLTVIMMRVYARVPVAQMSIMWPFELTAAGVSAIAGR